MDPRSQMYRLRNVMDNFTTDIADMMTHPSKLIDFPAMRQETLPMNNRILNKIMEPAKDETKTPCEWQCPLTVYGPVDIACDVVECDNSYKMWMDFPGMCKENISISVVNDKLCIEAVRSIDPNMNWIRKERAYGSVKRNFTLSDDVDTDKISSKYENGVLCVELMKKVGEKHTSKTISIQ